MEQRPPSFMSIVAVVWKVFFAILLIPAVLLLAYVAFEVLFRSRAGDAFAVLVAALLAVFVVWLRRR